MLDLKAQLLKAGLVTGDQVEKVSAAQKVEQEKKQEAEQRRAAQRSSSGPRGKPPGRGPPKGKGRKPTAKPPVDEDARWAQRVQKLAEGAKSDQYDAIRGWVERTRLDGKQSIPSEEAERFHFTAYEGTISWLTLEPPLAATLRDGTGAISAFMSFNGLRHCVLPADVARDIAKIRPEWLRHLDGGEILMRPPPEPKHAEAATGGDATDAKTEEGAKDASSDDAPSAELAPAPVEPKPEDSAPIESKLEGPASEVPGDEQVIAVAPESTTPAAVENEA